MSDEKTVGDYLGVTEDDSESIEADKTEEAAASEAEEQPGDDTAAEDAEETEAEAEGEEDEEKPKPKKKSSIQKRIERAQRSANRRAAEKEREAEYWRRQAEQALREGQPRPQGPEDARPKQEDYQDYAEFIRAEAQYDARRAVQEELKAAEQRRSEESKRAQAQERLQGIQGKAQEAMAKGFEEFDDFEEVAMRDDVRVTDVMVEAIVESEIAHKLQYHLGSNPEEAARIATLGPVAQVREIGKLEAKLSAPVAKKGTGAPPPLKKVGGKSAARQGNPDDLSIDEWMKRERAGTLKYR